MTPSPRVYLSPPHMSGDEERLVHETFASNWIAPLGPQVDAFEREFAVAVGSQHAVALASGTAAIHLALLVGGVGAGDEVVVSTLTFSGSVNPIRYVGATPVFVDSERQSWNLDPALLEETLRARMRAGKRPAAVIAVHLYGQSADLDRIAAVCGELDVPLIEDAAESLGARHGTRHPGTFGVMGLFSFNGNKVITTSGGGMLVTDDAALAAHARKLATQAREPAPHYEHREIGFNYRLSNVLAAIGRAQLNVLDARVEARRCNFATATAPRSGRFPAWSFSPRRRGACTRDGSPACWCVPIGLASIARRFASRWRRPTSSRVLSGNRCTCSRCSRSVNRLAGRWLKTCSVMACASHPVRICPHTIGSASSTSSGGCTDRDE